MAEEWSWSDAWVATAIGMASTNDGADLADVVAAGDALNHAILLREEVEQAVRRLSGSGLLLVEGDALRLSAKGTKATAPGRGGLFSQIDAVLRRLRRIPVAEVDWTLDPVTFDAAVDTYCRRSRG